MSTGSDVVQVLTPPALDINVAPIDPVSAVSGAAAAIAKLIDDILGDLNSPDQQKAAIAKRKLALIDKIVNAQTGDDLNQERIYAESA